MKKIIFATLICTAFTNCKSPVSKREDKLVGTWFIHDAHKSVNRKALEKVYIRQYWHTEESYDVQFTRSSTTMTFSKRDDNTFECANCVYETTIKYNGKNGHILYESKSDSSKDNFWIEYRKLK